jgi:hypothetical protein
MEELESSLAMAVEKERERNGENNYILRGFRAGNQVMGKNLGKISTCKYKTNATLIKKNSTSLIC